LARSGPKLRSQPSPGALGFKRKVPSIAAAQAGETQQVERKLVGGGLIVPLLGTIGSSLRRFEAVAVGFGLVRQRRRPEHAEQDQRGVFLIGIRRGDGVDAGGHEKTAERETANIAAQAIVHDDRRLIVIKLQQVTNLALAGEARGEAPPGLRGERNSLLLLLARKNVVQLHLRRNSRLSKFGRSVDK
jgi:hypothetical protein